MVNHSNNLISVSNSLQPDRADINLNSSDIIVLKNYDIQNSVNINSLSVVQSQHTSDINILKNDIVPNLDNLYVKKSGDVMNGQWSTNIWTYNILRLSVVNISQHS